jgi:hypothetical protein
MQTSSGPESTPYSSLIAGGVLFSNPYDPAGLVIEDGHSATVTVLARPMVIGAHSDWWEIQYEEAVTMYLLDETSDYILDESGNRILTT